MQMTDHKLLELAAKAADLWDILEETEDGFEFMGSFEIWNPLDNDGDALRLAVKLGIQFEQHPRWPYIAAFHSSVVGKFEEPHGDNPYAATRRAIVRAAAEIGRTK